MTTTTQTAPAVQPGATSATSTPPAATLGHRHGGVPAISPERGSIRFVQATPALLQRSFPAPHGREETWRFTPLPALQGLADAATPPGADKPVTVSVQPQQGVSLEQVALTDARVGVTPGPVDFVAARAWSSSEQANVVTITDEVDPAQPVHISMQGHGADGASYHHLLIEVAANTQASVLLETSGQAVLADNVEVRLGQDAQLTMLTVLDWQPGSVHVGAHSLSVGANAHIRHGVVNLGAAVVRNSTSADYTAPGGNATLLGLYVADAGHHVEHRLFVDHSQPHCKSRVEYKGALQGQSARSVWIGDVLIRSAAQGTDTYELNRNLVLTPGAQADSVPNLEIETGEIQGAGHASATGRFDDEQLFYLMARGIDRQQARRLVVRGFFADLIHQMGVPQVEQRLIERIEHDLRPAFATPAGTTDGSHQ